MTFSRRLAPVVCASLLLLTPVSARERERELIHDPDDVRRHAGADAPSEDCLQFNCEPEPSKVSKDNVGQLALAWQIKLEDIADTAPVYVSAAPTILGERDIVIVTTMGGHLIAVDANDGSIVWSAAPPNGPRWTTASPVVDPNREYVYAYGRDGYVHRHMLFDGTEVKGDGWPQLVTLKPEGEKCSSALSVVTTKSGQSYLYATIAGYPEGDNIDYQGHLVAIDLATGKQNVFNALCSDRTTHFGAGNNASNCRALQAGIWARAGAVYDPVTDRTYITTGDGAYDADQGGFNWGSSVLALRPDGTTDGGTPLDSFTPSDYQQLNDEDLDLSSTTIAILQIDKAQEVGRLAVQGGKDGRLRLLDLNDLSGQGGPRHVGGELQNIAVAMPAGIFTRPATWLAPDGTSWVFVTNFRGISAYSLVIDDSGPHLDLRWQRAGGGSSPIIDSGVLFYARDHEVRALDPESGKILWSDPSSGNIHWESPIFVNDTLYLPDHENGLSAYRLPR